MKICALVFLSFLSTAVFADGDAAAGKANSGVCAACHGANGKSAIPGYPHLAGQNAEYIFAQLKAFKSGERKGGLSAVMAPMTAALSERDMKDLAAYYSGLTP